MSAELQKLQDYLDSIVISNPNLTAGQIFDRLRPSDRERAGKYLRWPPGVTRPRWADRPPDIKPQRTRPYTQLIADLEKRRDAGVRNPRPRGPVNTGNISERPDDPPEHGA